MTSWRAYQEEVAVFFRALGLEAETNQTLSGVRTSHAVDVVVRSKHVGFDLLWIVECKQWNRRVSKLHVLALRQIVIDVGADRGLLMAEAGIQSGAIEAAQLTNIQLSSLAELRDTTGHALGQARLRNLLERVEHCRETYWKYSKDDRIRYGLRPETGNFGYSAKHLMDATQALVHQGLLGRFPPAPSDPMFLPDAVCPASDAASPSELVMRLDPLIEDLESRLAALVDGASTR